MALLASKPFLLIIICASAYALSAVAMAQAANRPHPMIFVIVAPCLVIAAITEILVLRQFDLGVTYIAIIGTESVLVVTQALMIGEGLGPRQ